jgi:hypothetical protein
VFMMEGWNWDHMRMLIFRVMEILLIISCLSENINLLHQRKIFK